MLVFGKRLDGPSWCRLPSAAIGEYDWPWKGRVWADIADVAGSSATGWAVIRLTRLLVSTAHVEIEPARGPPAEEKSCVPFSSSAILPGQTGTRTACPLALRTATGSGSRRVISARHCPSRLRSFR